MMPEIIGIVKKEKPASISHKHKISIQNISEKNDFFINRKRTFRPPNNTEKMTYSTGCGHECRVVAVCGESRIVVCGKDVVIPCDTEADPEHNELKEANLFDRSDERT